MTNEQEFDQSFDSIHEAANFEEYNNVNYIAFSQSGSNPDANITSVEIYPDRIWLTYTSAHDRKPVRMSLLKSGLPAKQTTSPIWVRFVSGNYDISSIKELLYINGKLK